MKPIWIKRLLRLTKEHDWSRSTVAKRAGLHPSTLANWMKRGTIPKADKAIALARCFNLTVEELFDPDSAWQPDQALEADQDPEVQAHLKALMDSLQRAAGVGPPRAPRSDKAARSRSQKRRS